jgi:transcriptional regulator of arginine metabolism
MQFSCTFMNSKATRQREILEVCAEQAVATQGELRTLLGRRGHRVDQATLSRDIRELGLVKLSDGESYRYAPVEEASPVVRAGSEAALGRMVVSATAAHNLVVLKTHPGNASPAALALDHLGWKEILGTVAGDDTVFIATVTVADAKRLARKIESLTK